MSMPLERRERQRYCIRFAVHFVIMKDSETVCTGNGIIRDVSSDGVYFEPNQIRPLEVGSVIHLVARWPVRIERTIRIEWIVKGVIVRIDGRGVGVAIMNEHLERQVRNTPATVAKHAE
jgi:hypothetical protein